MAKWSREALRSGANLIYTSTMFYSYILFSKKLNTYYAGSTSDIRRRLLEHNSQKVVSTSSGIPWKLVWYAGFDSHTKAQAFEKYLKSSSGFAFRNKRLI